MADSWGKAFAQVMESGKPGVFMVRGRMGGLPGPEWICHDFDLGSLEGASPLEPLLPWMVESWSALPQAERGAALKKASFYAPHRRLFRSWALEGRAENPDEILFSDSNQRYEKNAWFEALARLFCFLCGDGPRAFLLRRGQCVSQGLIAFLQGVMDCQAKAPVILVLEVDSARSWAGPTNLDQWPAFIKRLDDRASLLRSRTEAVSGDDASPAAEPARSSPSRRPALSPALMESYRLLFCPEDALAILDTLPDDGVDEWDILKLICCECWANIFDFGRAGLQIDAVISRLKENRHLHRAQLLACRIAGWKRSEEVATRALQLAWDQALLMDDPVPVLHCRIHEVFIQEMFGSKPDLLVLADKLSQDLKAYKFDNVIGYLDTLVIHYDWIVRTRGWEAAVQKAKETLVRYKRLGNRYRQSILLHILGYLHAQTGRADEAFSFFQAGMRLRKRLGDTIELIKLCNGTGYFCFTVGKLSEALGLYGKALSLMESIGDHQETCLTLFNMVQVYFFTGCFEESLAILSCILDVMEILGYGSLPFHRKSKIQALAGMAAWHLGKESQALDYSQAAGEGIIDAEARPYVDLLRAILLEESAEPSAVDSAFDDCLELARGDAWLHLRLHILCAKALRLRAGGTGDPSGLLGKALEEARKNKYGLEASWIEALTRGAGSSSPPLLQIKAHTRIFINRLRSSARQEAMNLKLLDALDQIQFLQRFQSMINVGLTHEHIVERSRDLISEQIHPVRVRIRDIRVLAQDDQEYIVGQSLGEDSLRLEFDLRGSTRIAIDAEELHILSLALAHLSLILDLKGAQDILEEAARIDPLTGLLSRRELRERLQAEYCRCRRYALESNQGFSLLFIDLDRFKAYNDNLGHGAGDLVLQHFARLLKESFRSMDLIGRWGGDEFLVVLPATMLPGSEQVAERIIHSLKAARGFSAELSAAFGREIEIPREQWLGCSMGISIYVPGSDKTVEDLINEADTKLYRAKEAGRGRVET